MGVLPAPSVLSPEETATAHPSTTVSLYSPAELVNVSPVSYQHQMIWRSVPWVGISKVGVLEVWSKPFTLQGEAGSWGSLPIVWHCSGDGVCGESVSQPFLPVSMCVFFQPPHKQESASFWISLRGSCSMCNFTFGSSERRGKFTILVQSSLECFFQSLHEPLFLIVSIFPSFFL